MKNVIIDGWNLFSYDGIPNDSVDRKTIAVKSLGNKTFIIMLNVKQMIFEVWEDDDDVKFVNERFSNCLKFADTHFETIIEL